MRMARIGGNHKRHAGVPRSHAPHGTTERLEKMRSAYRVVMGTACAAGLSLASNALAQTTQPVQINDVLYGLNRANPAETVQHLRGDPTPVNGGSKLGSTWNAGSIQFLQFDNLDGFRHAYDGNLLAGDFGSAANGFKLYNLETRRTAGATTPGNTQPLFDFATYNAANPTSPLTIARGAGLSVSPQNNRIAVTGVDASLNGLFYVMDYNAGAAPGTGAGAAVSNGRQLSGVVQNGSASKTTPTARLAKDKIFTLKHPTTRGAAAG